jgi:hypothetical protein
LARSERDGAQPARPNLSVVRGSIIAFAHAGALRSTRSPRTGKIASRAGNRVHSVDGTPSDRREDRKFTHWRKGEFASRAQDGATRVRETTLQTRRILHVSRAALRSMLDPRTKSPGE